MAAVHNEELFLGWYLLTLKLRETVESRLPKKSTYAGGVVPNYEPRPPKSEWVISIDEKLSIKEKLTRGRQDNVPGSWANLSIYRIPRYLKRGEDKAWVPQIVSLGPYHHGDEHLRHMEQHKWRCLHRILERSGQGIALYLDSVKKVERKARACYEGRISMNRDEFVDMMVLDGCFVIEMFQGFVEGFEELGYPPNDPVLSMRGSILQIQRDMIMLENQIPLFILDRLLGLQSGDPNQKERVAKLALQFFSPLIGIPLTEFSGTTARWLTIYPLDDDHSTRSTLHDLLNLFDEDSSRRLVFDPLYDHGKYHCLEVVWRSLLHLGLKRPKSKKWSQSRKRLTFCLSELRKDGIQVKRRDARRWDDIQFKDGILRIPPIEIHEGTRSLFLNLIAFEQSQFNCGYYITSYVIFMRTLINSPEDVLYLRDCQIIHHCLGSDAEVADLFHQLCQEVIFNIVDSHLYDLCIKVSSYRSRMREDHDMAVLKHKWNFWGADLKEKYFNSPWSTISVIAASILLVLTFTQTVYGGLSYHRSLRS